jgi:hypothetical protein
MMDGWMMWMMDDAGVVAGTTGKWSLFGFFHTIHNHTNHNHPTF